MLPARLAVDIESLVQNIDYAATEVTQAVKDCGASNNTACATDLESLANSIDSAAEDATSALTNCKAKNVACVQDVIGIALDLGSIVKEIGVATKVCKG